MSEDIHGTFKRRGNPKPTVSTISAGARVRLKRGYSPLSVTGVPTEYRDCVVEYVSPYGWFAARCPAGYLVTEWWANNHIQAKE